jgi:hypothetical protein
VRIKSEGCMDALFCARASSCFCMFRDGFFGFPFYVLWFLLWLQCTEVKEKVFFFFAFYGGEVRGCFFFFNVEFIWDEDVGL